VIVGAPVQTGDTYGLIRFGSRVDTYLPAGSELVIRQGQRAIGGETVLARLASTPAPLAVTATAAAPSEIDPA
jgi:phosphatidylserine decarboxylase